jgi:hypothetical protein
MTDREKDGLRGLALLQQLKPPAWMSEMQRYYAQHARFRSEDIRRLMETAGQTAGPVAQQESRAIELLQHLATKSK